MPLFGMARVSRRDAAVLRLWLRWGGLEYLCDGDALDSVNALTGPVISVDERQKYMEQIADALLRL